jgi:NAD(P)-dependent dehydrogenase (short-subunit alcohol dehydrogenase family)
MSATEPAPEGFKTDLTALAAHAGEHVGHTQWRTLTQEQVNLFADLTEDHHPIHIDPKHAKTTPFGTTIVHGYFTVAMLAAFLQELILVQDLQRRDSRGRPGEQRRAHPVSVVAFLLSGDAGWLAGQTLVIDGGLTLPGGGEPTGLAPDCFLDPIGDLT